MGLNKEECRNCSAHYSYNNKQMENIKKSTTFLKGDWVLWAYQFLNFQILTENVQWKIGVFSSVLWRLLVTMFCNYPSIVYRLVYQEARIRSSTLIQTVKGVLLLNYSTLDTIFISSYPPLTSNQFNHDQFDPLYVTSCV